MVDKAVIVADLVIVGVSDGWRFVMIGDGA